MRARDQSCRGSAPAPAPRRAACVLLQPAMRCGGGRLPPGTPYAMPLRDALPARRPRGRFRASTGSNPPFRRPVCSRPGTLRSNMSRAGLIRCFGERACTSAERHAGGLARRACLTRPARARAPHAPRTARRSTRPHCASSSARCSWTRRSRTRTRCAGTSTLPTRTSTRACSATATPSASTRGTTTHGAGARPPAWRLPGTAS